MNKIGEGYYYSVYDLKNGRVFKRSKSKIRIFFYILISRRFNPDFFREYKNTISNIPNIKFLYTSIHDRLSDESLLGNPLFTETIDYTQDKVTVLKSLFSEVTRKEGESLIDSYIILIKKLWSHGIADEVYNFTMNCALDHAGNVILIDFNEVTFDKTKVLHGIATEAWLRRWSYSHLSPELQKYYQEKMRSELTPSELDRLWNTI